MKNTMLADLVEELRRSGLRAAPAEHCYAEAGDVACDFCTGRKLKALKSCLQCLVSYCEQHLQPHYESLAFENHKLLEPCQRLQDNICPHHGKAMKIFCRTDQRCICYLCSMEEHKEHCTVLASEERTERQGDVGARRQSLQHRIQDWERDVKLLQEEEDTITDHAERAVKSSEKVFTQLVRLLKNRSSEVKQQIRSRQKAELNPVVELREKLQQEIAQLKRKDEELERLSHIQDNNEFLHSYPSLVGLSEPTDRPSIHTRPLHYFEDAATTVSELRDVVQEVLCDVWTKISLMEAPTLPQANLKTRADFLQYAKPITLDPNTANQKLLLSDGNRKAREAGEMQLYPGHRDRFADMFQALSRESLSGRHYWEVERGSCEVSVAVTYRDISRTGYESGFGNDEKSWALECFSSRYELRHNSVGAVISGPQSSKIGVYLDHRAGILSFYSVSESMALLHTVHSTFTQPLHAGVGVFGFWCNGSAEFCKID